MLCHFTQAPRWEFRWRSLSDLALDFTHRQLPSICFPWSGGGTPAASTLSGDGDSPTSCELGLSLCCCSSGKGSPALCFTGRLIPECETRKHTPLCVPPHEEFGGQVSVPALPIAN